MIVAHVSDPLLSRSIRAAARAEEDVISDPARMSEALDLGFPRLVVLEEGARLPWHDNGTVPVLEIDEPLLRRWEGLRRSADVPRARVDFIADRLSGMIEAAAVPDTWVDGVLSELTRAAGRRLPPTLRGFARRILEFPYHYTNLFSLADACGLSRGALKAKFRRRDLASPYAYQRWLRTIAVAHILSDRTVTVAVAARRAGFTSDGNLCRMMAGVCDMTPTELRSAVGWNRLLISFAWLHLRPEALEAWAELDGLFELRTG